MRGGRARSLCVVLATLFGLSLNGYAQDTGRVDFRTSFKPGHNLTLNLVVQQTSWKVSDTESVSGGTSFSLAPGAQFRYSFHVNIVGNTGFALGTGLSAFSHEDAVGEAFSPGWSVSFPSISVGAVQNLGQDTRLTGFFEYAATYFPKFVVFAKTNDGLNETEEVAVSFAPDSLLTSLQIEQFLSRTLSVVLSGGYRKVFTYCLGGCGSQSFVNDIQFDQEGLLLGLGMNWKISTVFGE